MVFFFSGPRCPRCRGGIGALKVRAFQEYISCPNCAFLIWSGSLPDKKEGTIVKRVGGTLLGKFYIIPVLRTCTYVLYCKSYVKQLEDGLKMLRDTRAALRRQVNTARTLRKTISPEVESWLAEADAIDEATRRFISGAASRNHFYQPLARYSLSRKSVEMLRQLLERERDGNLFHKVADPAPPPRVGSTFVRILNPKFSTPN